MKRTVVYIGAAAILFFVWWVLSSFLALPIVPNPWSVVSCLQSIFLSSIAIHAIYSLGRIALGLVLAVGIGYPIGIFMGYAARADRIFSPFVYLMYPVPKIALLPILMLLAGVGEISKVLMLFLIIVFQVIIAVRDAVRAIPQETYMPRRFFPFFAMFFGRRLCPNSLQLCALPWRRRFPYCFLRRHSVRNMVWDISSWTHGFVSIIWRCMQESLCSVCSDCCSSPCLILSR